MTPSYSRKIANRKLTLVWFSEDERLMRLLTGKLGLSQSATIRLALRRLAEQEHVG